MWNIKSHGSPLVTKHLVLTEILHKVPLVVAKGKQVEVFANVAQRHPECRALIIGIGEIMNLSFTFQSQLSSLLSYFLLHLCFEKLGFFLFAHVFDLV